MGNPAIERDMGSATFKASGPEPAMVRQQHGHTALTMAVKNQQWCIVATMHNCVADNVSYGDSAEPSTPIRRLLNASGQFSRYGMTSPGIGQAWIETAIV